MSKVKPLLICAVPYEPRYLKAGAITMAVHIVTYDLRQPGRDYEPLLKAIRSYTHCHCLKSAFFIETGETVAQVRDNLTRFVDANDQLYVINMKQVWAATRKEPCTDWLLQPRSW